MNEVLPKIVEIVYERVGTIEESSGVRIDSFLKQHERTDLCCVSIGYLIKDFDDKYIICQTHRKGIADGFLLIPKKTVISIHEFSAQKFDESELETELK